MRNFIQDLDHIITETALIRGLFHDHGCITLLVLLMLHADTTDHNIVLKMMLALLERH